eukprot:5609113-Amphidinium_carterae.1
MFLHYVGSPDAELVSRMQVVQLVESETHPSCGIQLSGNCMLHTHFIKHPCAGMTMDTTWDSVAAAVLAGDGSRPTACELGGGLPEMGVT